MTTNIQTHKRSRTLCQPKGTKPYTVGDSDTLEKISLIFNSTPSELTHLNKLNTRMVFPGQILYVPEKSSEQISSIPSPTAPINKTKEGEMFVLENRRSSIDDPSSSSSISPIPSQNEKTSMVWSMSRQLSPTGDARPGRVERLSTDSIVENESMAKTVEEPETERKESLESHHESDEESLQRFLKFNVRLIDEDRRKIAGTLLVTPNAVMFDPDLLDPCVQKEGILKFGVIINMNYIAGITLFEDIALYEHQATSRDGDKRQMCYSSSIQQKNLHENLTSDEKQVREVMNNILNQIDQEKKSTEATRVLFRASSVIQRQKSKSFIEHPLTLSDHNNVFHDHPLTKSTGSDPPLHDYQHVLSILSDNDINQMSRSYDRVPSRGYQLENCISIDQYKSKFNEIDKLLHDHHLHYSAPRPIEIPYYLCLKVLRMEYDTPSLSARTTTHQERRARLEKHRTKHPVVVEYWFSVPKEKTEKIYNFFLRWTPERQFNSLIDDDDNIVTNTSDQPTCQGFVRLANDDPELNDDYHHSLEKTDDKSKKKSHYLKRQNTLLKEWEIISVDEIYRRYNSTHSDQHHQSSDDFGISTPLLLHPSLLLNEDQLKQILLELPARLHGLNWYLLFSTEMHGFSLNQLYRRAADFDHDYPSLIVVKDVEQHIFGAFVPHQLIVSESFYGNGESFLFTFYPEFRAFNWSGANEFYVKGDLHSLGFGIGDGTHGLWVDGDLYRGRTCTSQTFNNDRLTANEDFIVASVELWTFVD